MKHSSYVFVVHLLMSGNSEAYHVVDCYISVLLFCFARSFDTTVSLLQL